MGRRGATLVLRLAAEGLLDLDGSAAPFVEDVTIRGLLNHTSGLDDFVGDPVGFFEPYRRDPAHRWELGPRAELRLVLEKARLFPPGEGWAYHGSNYIVLRLVVEGATGMGLREALRQRILAPLGLGRTDLVEGPLRGGDCARLPPAGQPDPPRRARPRGHDGDRRPRPPRRRRHRLDRGRGRHGAACPARRRVAPRPPAQRDARRRRLRLGRNRPLRPRNRRDLVVDGEAAFPVRSRVGPPGLLARIHGDRSPARTATVRS